MGGRSPWPRPQPLAPRTAGRWFGEGSWGFFFTQDSGSSVHGVTPKPSRMIHYIKPNLCALSVMIQQVSYFIVKLRQAGKSGTAQVK